MSLDDDRVQFYLRHRKEIETWAALGDQAAGAFDAWLASFAGAVEECASQLGSDVRFDNNTSEENTWPNYRLTRISWAFERENPAASVSLEWSRKKSASTADRLLPYVGVRSARGQPVGDALRTSERLRQRRAERNETSSAYWAAFRYHPLPADFPASKEGYKQALLAALEDCWKAYAPLLDDAAKR